MRGPAVPSVAPTVHKVVSNAHEETERDTVALSQNEKERQPRGSCKTVSNGYSQGAGEDNMTKKSELLINVVIAEQAKVAVRPDPKQG